MSNEALWHRVEHSGYTADLPVWLELVRRYGSSAVEIGAGCGRVSGFLAAQGISVTAVETRLPLFHALAASRPPGSRYEVVHGDALDIDLSAFGGREFVIFPLLVLQVICAEHGRKEGLAMALRFERHFHHVGFNICEEFPPDFRADNSTRSSSFPSSSVVRIEGQSDAVLIERERVGHGTKESQVETLERITSRDLQNVIGREPLEIVDISASEGVVASKVVVF